jgi:hypothetical protein
VTGKTKLLHIFCDEAGFTGNKLLDAEQEIFSYVAVAIEPEAAKDMVARLRRDFRLQSPELKGSALIGRPQGRRVVARILKECSGQYHAVFHLKPYALASKFFEYIFEPAVSDFNSFLYSIDFHRVISTVLFVYFRASDRSAEAVLEDFVTFAHRGDVSALERIFPSGIAANYKDDFLSAIGTFALLHQDTIKHEVLSFREAGVPNWLLDLTGTSLFGLLAAWGEKARQLSVTCDESKPLRKDMTLFDTMLNRKDKLYVEFQGKKHAFSFNLKHPIVLADSKLTPGLQIADVLASATSHVWKSSYRGQLDDELRRWQSVILEHCIDDCIWPDLRDADLSNPKCFANTMILQELIDRSVRKENLFEGLPAMFRVAMHLHPKFVREHRLQR